MYLAVALVFLSMALAGHALGNSRELVRKARVLCEFARVISKIAVARARKFALVQFVGCEELAYVTHSDIRHVRIRFEDGTVLCAVRSSNPTNTTVKFGDTAVRLAGLRQSFSAEDVGATHIEYKRPAIDDDLNEVDEIVHTQQFDVR